MSYSKATTLFTFILLFVTVIEAQSPKDNRAPRTPSEKTAAALAPGATAGDAQPGALAIVNGQTLTLLDIDPKVRQAVQDLDAKLAEARRSLLDERINSLLLEIEAKKRGVTADELYNGEVANRVVAPTEEQIKAEYDEHPDLYGANNLASMRDYVGGRLRDRQEKKLYGDLVSQLRLKIPVAMGADVNTPNLALAAVLATVGGNKITLNALSERLGSRLYDLRQSVYQSEKEAIDNAINDLLLKAEAKRRNTTPDELLRAEITDKIQRPSDSEIEKFYQENKARINADLPSVREKISEYLENRQREQLEQSLIARLRAGAAVRLLIKEPEPVAQAIDTAHSPSRGRASASVTLVEFGDFQCPPCGQMYPVVEEALKPYGADVRFVFREFPLSIHPNARKAAEAAMAANAQGRFWEYMDLLFKNQRALDTQSLKKYATEVGLDRKRFDAALDGGLYAAEVRHDIREGEMYRVQGTPTYFINGVRLSYDAYSVEGIRKAIDGALARASQSQRRAMK